MRRTVHFEPSARLQSILSRELVADPNVAILEFVKNSYDAGAEAVLIEFALDESGRDGVLTIADDGEGMNFEGFKRNWMRPGFSEKADDDYALRRGRVPAGEKGLGRLAAGRLGEVLDVFTRRSRRAPWWHAHFEWADFDDMDQTLADIDIPVDDESEPDVIVAPTGTVVEITGLRQNWDARVPGRKAPGRHPTRLGRLRQDLEMLLLPLSASGDQFEIWLEHNSTQPDDEPSGRIEPPSLELIHYRYDFEIKRRGRGWQVQRTVRRGNELLSSEVAAKQNLKPRSRESKPLPSGGEGGRVADVGLFSGSFFYAPDSAEHLRKIRAPVGVLLYRDGIRVEPYGQPGNDWLGAQAKKASRQGYAAIQPAALYGAVHITRSENPSLRSQANREGLIENAAYETFIDLCRREFARFESLVFDEYLKPGWRPPEEDRRRRAQATQSYALSLMRALMHGVNQPVATANATLDRLQTLIDKRVDDEAIEKQLQELHDRAAAQLSQISAAVERVLEVVDFDPEAEHFDLAELARELVDHGAAMPEDVTVRIQAQGDLTVDLPRAPIYEALKELIVNAANAPRAEGVDPEVIVTGASENGVVRLEVTDNGTGIDPAVRGDLFKRAASTKGTVGMGLIIVRQLMRLISGDVELEDSGPDGARFALSLPRAPQ